MYFGDSQGIAVALEKMIATFLEHQNRRHIFHCFRYEIRWIIAPLYLLFSVFDYIYKPEMIIAWVILRLIFLSWVFIAFEFLKFPKIRNRHSVLISMVTVALANNLINVMIFQSGGVESIYFSGLILVSTTGIEIFMFSRRSALLSNMCSYIPTVFIIWYSTLNSGANFGAAYIQTGFLILMTTLSWIYRSRLDDIAKTIARTRTILDNQNKKMQRTEFLKNHFPLEMRQMLEAGNGVIPRKKFFPTAVVGFADITSSTAIGNVVHLNKDWEIKDRFLSAATSRATQSNMVVLTHLGDGFLFIANYNEHSIWPLNLVTFFENLFSDFQKITQDCGLGEVGVTTGIKCGVALGPSIVGFIGSSQSYFTAIGPDVNLAARLCNNCHNNEILISGRVWYLLQHQLSCWETSKVVLNLKGFDDPIPAFRVKPRALSNQSYICNICGSPMSLVTTEEGFFDFRCVNHCETEGEIGKSKNSISQIAPPKQLVS